MADSDTLRALTLASLGVGASTEAQLVHLGHHGLCPACSLGTALRQQSQRTYAGRYEEHGRTVLAGHPEPNRH